MIAARRRNKKPRAGGHKGERIAAAARAAEKPGRRIERPHTCMLVACFSRFDGLKERA